MISNTLKFKTGNRIGSNPVLSELIRSFELQRPVQRSLTPKWDLSWVLVCLQKPPFEPLDKASKFHVTIKTAFLLALATAKRCSEIQSTLVISNSKGLSEILRDIRTSTYQICRVQEKNNLINHI